MNNLFKVFPINNAHWSEDSQVAADIEAIYQFADTHNGDVVGQHTVPSVNKAGPALFLVVRYPDPDAPGTSIHHES
jgi:hypothetical protein